MQPERCCDECGRLNVRIHRRYKGHRYCVSCYAREFIARACPCCGNSARLHRRFPEAICRRCETARPCVRCGESYKPVGKISIYGVVCASCAPYFQPEAPCEICGRLSRRLTRISRFGDGLRRCERCAISDHGTCSACHRYRKLNKSGHSGLCASCQTGEVRCCDSCGGEMPLGRGKKCEACYWRQLLEKRARMNCAMLKSGAMQEAFAAFATWLGGSCGNHKASLTLSRYVVFFQEIESYWCRIPSYLEMLERFGVDTLRRHRKAIQWLSESGQIILDPKLKDSIAEEQRIRGMLGRFPRGTKKSLLVNEYASELRQRSDRRKVQVRTMRLCLTPAIGLIHISLNQDDNLPTQKSVDLYISAHPGQRASLTGFLSFLNNRYQSHLKMPGLRETHEARRAKTEHRLAVLAGCNWDERAAAEWIKLSLEYFHGVTGVSKKRLRTMKMNSENSAILVILEGREYFIPVPNACQLRAKWFSSLPGH